MEDTQAGGGGGGMPSAPHAQHGESQKEL